MEQPEICILESSTRSTAQAYYPATMIKASGWRAESLVILTTFEEDYLVKRLFTSLASLIVPVLCTSCSLLVAQGGRDLDKVFVPSKSRSDIQSVLGCPISEITYPQSLPATNFPELSHQAQMSHLFVTNDLRLKLKSVLIASQADYVYRGWLSSKRQRDGWGMGVAMIDVPTLGLGELYLFPYSIYWAIGESFRVHHFRVWYGEDDNFIGYVTLHDSPESNKPKNQTPSQDQNFRL